MKIVLDSNILISAIISQESPLGKLLESIKQKKNILINSEFQISELQRVMSYKHLQKFITNDDAENLLKTIRKISVVIEILPEINLSPDPNDNPILATAIAGHAELIVSGDKRHILELKKINNIPIVTAREALKRLNLDD